MLNLSLTLPKIDTGPFSFAARPRGQEATAKRSLRAVAPFDRWLETVTPSFNWRWAYLEHIRAQLHRITTGQINRLMLFVPPRHGKSSMVTVRYPVWRMERDPGLRVIIGSYSQMLANRFSRQARRIASERLELDTGRRAVEEWQTAAGGTFRAVGVGVGVTGQGGDLIIIDDPVKNREEAESEAYREGVWEWYTDDLYTRREPGAALVLIMTRWHADDLAGRILASEDAPNWTVVRLPAEAEEDDPLARPLGAALCPERYDLPELHTIRRVLGHSYHALYQQRPTAKEGDFFQRGWFSIVDAAPSLAKRVRYWDKAGTQGGDGAYTCGARVAYAGGMAYIEDIVRGRWDAGAREAVIRQTAELDGRGVTVWHEQEPGSGGKESANATTRNLAGFAVHSDRVTGDKAYRAEPLAAQAQAGNVRLVRGPWNAAFLNELTSFPMGKYKDQVDASSGAFNKLALPREAGVW